VQDRAITQLAIDKSLTLIAWEAMNHWRNDGSFGLHVFHKNNELAGYCSVIHGLELCGSTGDYGRQLTAVVIGFGATARDAVTALNAHGIHDVRVLTNRDIAAVSAPIPSVDIVQFEHDPESPFASTVNTPDGPVPLPVYLAQNDIVVNCTLQDPNDPLTYLTLDDLDAFRPGSLIIDVSVDEGMGFSWARATSFAEPMITVGASTNYYAVDHSPSLLWNSTTWEISEALMPFLRTVMEGPASWAESDTITRAIEIEGGRVRNEAILRFQGRSAEYPYLAV
jgi:alanine dehydrogenase